MSLYSFHEKTLIRKSTMRLTLLLHTSFDWGVAALTTWRKGNTRRMVISKCFENRTNKTSLWLWGPKTCILQPSLLRISTQLFLLNWQCIGAEKNALFSILAARPSPVILPCFLGKLCSGDHVCAAICSQDVQCCVWAPDAGTPQGVTGCPTGVGASHSRNPFFSLQHCQVGPGTRPKVKINMSFKIS